MIPLPEKIQNDFSSNTQQLNYLLYIETDPIIYIGSNKQTFGLNKTYYEDLDLKVSNISEKIDLKTKKVQYSDMTFTLSNFYLNEQYLSDRLSNAMGSNINLYLKTQSCDELDDCLLIAKLKIRKIKHNNKVVTIVAIDINLETLYVNLPKKTLQGGVDTNEAGNLRPVPILYGHLEDAPAVVYIEEDQTIKIIPDDSYFSNNEKEIEGIKQFYLTKQDGYDAEIMDRDYDNLISPNVVKVNLDKAICNVPCLPFINSLYTEQGVGIDGNPELFRTNQYETYHDYVVFNPDNIYGREGILKKYNGLWVSFVSELRLSKEFSYNYYQDGTYRSNSLGLTSRWLWQATSPDFDFMDNTETHKVGFQVYEFENIEGADRLDIKISDIDIFPVDVHFIGNMNIQTQGIAPAVETDNMRYARINIFFSDIKDDMVQPSHMVGGWNYGTPSEFTITNNGEAVNTNFKGRFWSTQKIELHAHSEYSPVGTGLSITEEGIGNQYITFLLSEWNNNTDNGGNYWQSIYSSAVDGLRKGLSSNIMVMAYSPDMQSGWEFTETPNTSLSITTNVSDMKVRKMWANKDILNKDFHVNAKGRVDTSTQYTNVYKIKGRIKVLTEKQLTFNDPTYPQLGVEANTVAYENEHQIELFKLLTNSQYKTKLINNEVHELMIKYEAFDGEVSYLWDIDVNNMNLAENYGDNDLSMFTDEGRPDRQGWIYDIAAKNYNFGAIEDGVGYWFKNIELVYAKINWENDTTISNITEADEQTETFVFNSKKGWTSSYAEFNVGLGYCYVIWLAENMELAYKLADTAPYIVKDILTNEMNINTDQIDTKKLIKASTNIKNNKMAFSISEQKESREILEEICRQSRLTFRFRPSDNHAVVDAIYNDYDLDTDFDKKINLDNAINYSFSKTQIEDLSVGGVKIRYGYDYATQKPDKEVEVALGDSFEEYKALYGIIKEEDYKIEMDAPFIVSNQSALEFAHYLLNYYKHQHLIVKCSLLCKYGFELEVGDVLKFNTNKTAFGKSLSETQENIDQTIYPLFYITKINKTLNKVDIETVQLHNLDQE